MPDSTQPNPLLICTSCGSLQKEVANFCEKCGAPVSPHAHSDFVLGIQSRGFALHKATHDPRQLIVVVGTWLWVAPSFLISLVFFVAGLTGVLQGEGWAARLISGLSLLGMLVFGTILYRTTQAWLEQRSGAQRSISMRRNDESEPDELQECLSCGKSFAPGLQSCPACGWSYLETTEN